MAFHGINSASTSESRIPYGMIVTTGPRTSGADGEERDSDVRDELLKATGANVGRQVKSNASGHRAVGKQFIPPKAIIHHDNWLIS